MCSEAFSNAYIGVERQIVFLIGESQPSDRSATLRQSEEFTEKAAI